MFLRKFLISSVLILFSFVLSNAQEAYKFAEVNNLRCDLSEVLPISETLSEMAKKPDSRVIIIVYGMEGYAIRYSESVRDWFVTEHGVDAEKVSTNYGGYNGKAKMELWIVPKGAKEPLVNPIINAENAVQFDHYIYAKNEYCGESRRPTLNEFAEFLNKEKKWRGYIIVYKGRIQKAKQDKNFLVKNYKIKPSRIKTITGSMDWIQAELWVAPPKAALPKPTLKKRTTSKTVEESKK